jgi:V8-like Glu-specific endopeptidase
MILAALGLLAQLAAPAVPSIEDSVALLFQQAEDGGMAFMCTATAYDVDGKNTLFLSAAHCVTRKDEKGDDIIIEDPIFLSADDRDAKNYVRAKLVEVGKKAKGYDYAILSAPLQMPVIPLGDEKTEPAHTSVYTVGAPTGIGKAYDVGVLSMKFIDRPIYVEDSKINWAGCMLVRVQTEGGSSGSAIVSGTTHTIIGVLVGHKASLTIAVPVSRVKEKDAKNILYPAEKK